MTSRRIDPSTVKWIMERTCLRKKNLTKEEADMLVDWAASESPPRLIYYYDCEFCGSIHMTSSPEAPEQHLQVS
jgi:hypothetical protein